MCPVTTPARTVPDEVQAQARALGDPTRFRIFRYIVDAARTVDVAELTSYTRLNHNAVRQHLSVLTSAGLVVEGQEERTRPGRPRLLYEVAPDAAGLWGTPGPYEQLATALAEAMRTGLPVQDVGHRMGVARARLVPRPGTDEAQGRDAVGVIEHEMARAGFRPARRRKGTATELVLENCPFESAAAVNAKDVCELHLGLARGLAEGTGGVEVEGLVPKNPHRAGCRLQVREV
jgi:predicted ArsR family transcriptional regulator